MQSERAREEENLSGTIGDATGIKFNIFIPYVKSERANFVFFSSPEITFIAKFFLVKKKVYHPLCTYTYGRT